MSIIDIVLELPEKLANLAYTLQEFLFDGITIGSVNISFWGLLGGVGLVVIIVAVLIKLVV